MTEITFQTAYSAKGTGLQGYCEEGTTYAELVACFGEPHSDGDGYKVDAQWILQFSDGTVATIYNYKSGKNYLGDDEGACVENLIGSDWHIGGTSEKAVDRVWAAIEASQTKQEPGPPLPKGYSNHG